jgi:O-antigen ligase
MAIIAFVLFYFLVLFICWQAYNREAGSKSWCRGELNLLQFRDQGTASSMTDFWALVLAYRKADASCTTKSQGNFPSSGE